MASPINKQNQAYSANFVNTAFMRNFLASSKEFRSRTCEIRESGDIYHLSLTVWRGERKSANQLFCINYKGKKSITWEKIYTEAKEKMDICETQGPDDIEEEVSLQSQEKKENVIVVSEHDKVSGDDDKVIRQTLMNLSSTEKMYDFANGIDGIMNRWFLLDKVNVSLNDIPTNNGGLLKAWVVPRDLISRLKTAINILFVKGFVYGEYEIEFKLILQANPFQAGLVMLATCPYSYGIIDKASAIRSVHYLINNTSSNRLIRKYSYITTTMDSYMDYRVAIQRPNILVDISKGGEGNITLPFKFHKTMIRNFDYSIEDTVNPGIAGSNFGSVGLYVLSALRTGSGNESSFNARVMYRFKRAQLAGMSNEARLVTGNKPLLPKYVLKSKDLEVIKNNILKLKNDLSKLDLKDPRYRERNQQIQKELKELYHSNQHELARVQGPVISVLHGGRAIVDTMDDAISSVEKINFSQRKGLNIRNKDKPVDNLTYCQVVPRSRREFGVAKGIDDAVTLAIANNEGVNFFETFPDEPKNFKELATIKSFFGRFDWESNKTPGTILFKWNLDPQIAPNVDRNKQSSIDMNFLPSTLCSSLSMFTNYWGTIELEFQFVKTQYHRGAIEISVAFGRELSGDETLSSYVKICNIEDHSNFSFTIPYIYDTMTRKVSGTSLPLTLPDITNSASYALFSAATLQVKVVNSLSNPTSVNGTIECLVWMKAGKDFGMNFLRPSNTIVFPQTVGDMEKFWYETEKPFMAFKSNTEYNQYYYGDNVIDVLPKVVDAYITQAPEEDFNQPNYFGNPATSCEHTDFKDILKMPLKIVSSYTYTNLITYKPIDDPDSSVLVRNYISIPVAPINFSLWRYLRHFIDIPRGIGRDYTYGSLNGTLNMTQSVQYQINTMFSFFKGSISYTIMTYEHKDKTAPIYVVYVPHDYSLRNFEGPLEPIIAHAKQSTNVVGDAHIFRWPLGSNADAFIDIANAGTYLGVIIPSVNPSERFTVPMSTMNNWLLMNRVINRYNPETNENIIRTMREQSEWFNGHLVFYSTNDFKFDVFLSTGDDIELGGFLGKWPTINPWALFSMKDNWRTQGPLSLDFPIRALALEEWHAFVDSPFSNLVNWMKMNWETIFSVAMYLPGSIGSISQKLAMCLLLRSGARRLGEAKQIVEGPLGRTIRNISNDLETVANGEALSFMGLLGQLFPSINNLPDIKDTLWNLCTNLIHAMLAQSWQNTAFAIVNILYNLKLITSSSMSAIGSALQRWMSHLFTNVVQAPQDENEGFLDTITLLVTTLAATFQVRSTGGVLNYAKEIINWSNFKYVAGLTSVMNFTRRLFVMIQGTIKYLTKEKDPLINVLNQLKYHEGELAEFVNEASLYLNTFNDNDMKLLRNRVRFLKTIFRAYQLKGSLIAIGKGDQITNLIKICDSVIKKAEQQKYLLRCDVIKMEPYVLTIESESGIGKSYSAARIASEILQAYEYKQDTTDIIYTISPGVQYWNGYTNQPVLLYDDWCNLRDESMISHISQLYALKTTAPFNVPRAELENKEQMADPLAILLCTNTPFPEHESFTMKEAIYRRRDKLVRFVRSDPSKKISDYSEAELSRFEHIKVQYYSDVKDVNSLQTTLHSFDDFLIDLKQDVALYKASEVKKREVQYRFLTQYASKSVLDEVNLVNPFDLLRKANDRVMSTKLTSEVMESDVLKLYEMLKQAGLQNQLKPEIKATIERAVNNEITQDVESEVQADNVQEFDSIVSLNTSWFDNLTLPKCSVHQNQLMDVMLQIGINKFTPDMDNEVFKFEIMKQLNEKCSGCTLYGWIKTSLSKFKEATVNNIDNLIRVVSNASHLCSSCMRFTSSSNWFWCAEHSHGLCIDCVIKVRQGSNYHFQCREHSCPVTIDERGFLSKILAALIYCAGEGVVKFLKIARSLLVNSFGRNFIYLSLQALRIYLCVGCVQTNDEDFNYDLDDEQLWDDHEAFISTNVYKLQQKKGYAEVKQLGDYSYDDLVRLTPFEIFLEEHKETLKIEDPHPLVYRISPCKHKYALGGFIYSSGEYIMTLNEGSYAVEDRYCCSRCLLKDLDFCKYLWRAYRHNGRVRVFDKYVKEHLYSEVITSVPRFAILPNHRELEVYKKEILFLTHTPWYEYYIPKCGIWLVDLFKKMAPTLAVIGVVVASWKTFGVVINFVYDKVFKSSSVTQESGDRVMELRNKVRNKRLRKQKGNKDIVHANIGNNKLDQQMDKIASNYVIIEVCGVKFVAIGIKSNVVLLNRHIWERIKDKKTMSITFVSKLWEKIDIAIPSVKVNFFDGKDLVAFTFTGALRFKDITKFFVKDQDLRVGNITRAVMMEVDAKLSEISDIDLSVSNFKVNHEAECSITNTRYCTDRVVEYDYGRPGICGSVVVIDRDRPLLAIHISGKSSCQYGCGVIVTQEDLIPLGVYEVQSYQEVEDTGDDCYYFGDDCNIHYEGTISKDLIPHVPDTTTLKESVISKYMETPTRMMPAILSKNDPSYIHEKSPLYYGVKKNGLPPKPFPPELLRQVTLYVVNFLCLGKKIKEPEIYDVKRAILGPDIVVPEQIGNSECSEGYYNYIPEDTSPGWPYCVESYRNKYKAKGKGKVGWMTYIRDDNGKPVDVDLNNKLMEELECNSELRRNGTIVASVFCDLLKDEKRKIEKAMKVGGTRLFSMASVEHTIALRRFTLDLTTHLRYNRINNRIAIGINTESIEWTKLFNLLVDKENYFTTDFSNFGAGLQLDVVESFLVLIQKFYNCTDKDLMEARMLIKELSESLHVVGNTIYRTKCGSPSGAAITAEINSFSHLIYAGLVWVTVAREIRNNFKNYKELGVYFKDKNLDYLKRIASNMTLEEFHQNVYMCVYGDDGIFSVSNEYKEVYNGVVFNLVMSQHGIGVTDANKLAKIVEFSSIDEVSFLKRKFKPFELSPKTFVVPAIDWLSVEECVRWVHKDKNRSDVEILRQNVEASLYLAWGHGIDKYNDWLEKLTILLSKENIRVVSLSWEDITLQNFPDLAISFD